MPVLRASVALVAQRAQVVHAVAPVLANLDPKLEIHLRAEQILNVAPRFRTDGAQHRALLADDDSLVARALAVNREAGYDAIVPVSARTGKGMDELKKLIVSYLPEGPKYFPDDMMTDQPERLICAELIREKALQHLRDEVPHGIGVEMMGMEKMNDNFMEINATIYCERDAHKGIIIGKHGAMLQTIGSEAREDIEKLLGLHVNLKLWVKVRPDWRNRASDLRTLGYDAK